MPTAQIDVRVQPRAATNELVGVRDGRLLVRVTAPPLDGRANDAVCALIAKRAGVPKRAVRLVRGERSRDKRIAVDGMADDAALRAALGL